MICAACGKQHQTKAKREQCEAHRCPTCKERTRKQRGYEVERAKKLRLAYLLQKKALSAAELGQHHEAGTFALKALQIAWKYRWGLYSDAASVVTKPKPKAPDWSPLLWESEQPTNKEG